MTNGTAEMGNRVLIWRENSEKRVIWNELEIAQSRRGTCSLVSETPSVLKCFMWSCTCAVQKLAVIGTTKT